MSQFIEMFGNPLSLNQKNELKRLGECCILNPRRPNIALCDTDKVSFIPMPAVSEDGYLVDMTDEEYGKVKKGFTYFENNDVLFAKITPCMENGKGAIVHGLTNGIGMGSTEFHVLRPINGISSPYWLLALTRMPIFRERAAKNMSGTGGQKRVSASYLDHFMVGLPAIEEQRRFEAIYRQADKSKFGDFKSQFIEMFGNPTNETVGKLGNELFSFASGKANIKSNLDPSFQYNCYGGNGITGKSKEYLLKDKTIVIGRVGEYCGCVHQTSDYCWVTDNAIYLKTYSDIYRFKFIYYMFVMMDFHRYASETGQPKITQAPLLSCTYPIPTLEAQDIFISIAEQADKSKSVIQKALVYLNDIQSDELGKIA